MRESTIKTPQQAMRYWTALHQRGITLHRFSRESLPNPESYYSEHLGKLKGRGKWRTALCVFHSESNPSLAVNVETGAFICHACGVRGGDVLDFHRQRYGMGFKEAAQALGAWGAR